MENKNIVNINGKKNSYFGSISFLVFVVLLTISLFLYNNYLIEQSTELSAKNTELEGRIKEVESDDNFMVFALIELNKNIIEKLSDRSDVTKYMEHIELLGSKYDLLFRGFNFSDGNVKTSAVINSDDNGVAYKKLVNFMEKYRADENALFNIKFINRVSGYDNMKINLDFEIK